MTVAQFPALSERRYNKGERSNPFAFLRGE